MAKAFSNAFQVNAFQNNAFQVAVADKGGWLPPLESKRQQRRRLARDRLEAWKQRKLDEELLRVWRQVHGLDDDEPVSVEEVRAILEDVPQVVDLPRDPRAIGNIRQAFAVSDARIQDMEDDDMSVIALLMAAA